MKDKILENRVALAAEQTHGSRSSTTARLDSDIPFSFTDGARWYAVMSNIRCEERAKAGLMARGFRCFLPVERRWVRHARTKEAVNRPLLSRYLFVETDANQRGFFEIRTTDGVEAVLCNGDVPAPMPSGLVEEFIRRQLKGEFDQVAREAMPIGARIKIMDGQFEDFFATVVSFKRSGGEILAELIGKKTRTRVSLLSVRPA